MKAYHFAALTAIMGLSFLAGGIATALVRQRVENWYRMFSRPEKVPPPPAYGWGWRSIYVPRLGWHGLLARSGARPGYAWE